MGAALMDAPRAMVLAAGLGTRMRPLSLEKPKPLIELAGRPLIDHALDKLAAAGVDEAVVNVHYLAGQIERHLAGRQSPLCRISDERGALLETGGGVKKALPLLGDAPFLVLNTDSVWHEKRPNLKRLLDHWDEAAMDGLLLLARREASLGYEGAGDFFMAADGCLSRRGGAPATDWVHTGVLLMHPRLLDGTPDGAFSLNLPWDTALARGRLYGLELEGFWMHVGTPAALREAGDWLRRAGGA
jgi:MurNAc alpha-1-phosphate uridylyltransferase